MTRRRGRGLIFGSRRTALLIGYGGVLVGAYALWEAYEKRGVRRPFAAKFLPGA